MKRKKIHFYFSIARKTLFYGFSFPHIYIYIYTPQSNMVTMIGSRVVICGNVKLLRSLCHFQARERDL